MAVTAICDVKYNLQRVLDYAFDREKETVMKNLKMHEDVMVYIDRIVLTRKVQ